MGHFDILHCSRGRVHPGHSPDMSYLDFWFWGLAMEDVRKSRPSTLNELKVEAFAESVDQEEVKRSARST